MRKPCRSQDLGEIRTLLGKNHHISQFQMRTEYLATFPELRGHRNAATLTTVMVPPETGCFFLAAAVYDNLDCSDVIDSPHFSIATKLLEVMDSHLHLLVLPSPLFCGHTGRVHLWSLTSVLLTLQSCFVDGEFSKLGDL